MAAANTYVSIATQTLGSAAASVTFSSIPSTYTDLVLVSFSRSTIASLGNNLYGRLNGDTANNYSFTDLIGDGTSATADRASTFGYAFLGQTIGNNSASGLFNISICNFQNYANTTTYKTMLGRSNAADNTTQGFVSLWRSTAAINQIVIYPAGANNLNTGSTFTLYGILAA